MESTRRAEPLAYGVVKPGAFSDTFADRFKKQERQLLKETVITYGIQIIFNSSH
jgi:hypothetical protein